MRRLLPVALAACLLAACAPKAPAAAPPAPQVPMATPAPPPPPDLALAVTVKDGPPGRLVTPALALKWQEVTASPHYIRLLALDPQRPEVIYYSGDATSRAEYAGGRWRAEQLAETAFSALAWAPAGESMYAGAGWDFYRSGDGGRKWERVYAPDPEPVPTQAIEQILFGADGAIYARHQIGARSGSGLDLSRDGGRTWQSVYGGHLDFGLVRAGERLCALTRMEDHQNGSVGPSGLHCSDDFGHTWTRLATLPEWTRPLVAGSTLVAYYGGDAGNGLLLSGDGGLTWRRRVLPPGIERYIGLAAAPGPGRGDSPPTPEAATTVLLAGAGPHTYLSRDLGDTWREVSGLPGLILDQVRFDRRDGRLYAISYDGSQNHLLTAVLP